MVKSKIVSMDNSEYEACVNMRISEGQFHWERFNLILLINTIIFGFVGFTYSKEFTIPIHIKFILPIIGIILCILWLQMTQRGIMWIQFWTKKAREIERRHKIIEKDNTKIYPFIEGYKYKSSHETVVNTHFVSFSIIVLFIFLYLGIFIEAFLRHN